jgi:hypothetical protein
MSGSAYNSKSNPSATLGTAASGGGIGVVSVRVGGVVPAGVGLVLLGTPCRVVLGHARTLRDARPASGDTDSRPAVGPSVSCVSL